MRRTPDSCRVLTMLSATVSMAFYPFLRSSRCAPNSAAIDASFSGTPAEDGERRLPGERSAGIGENVEALFENPPGGVAMGKNEIRRADDFQGRTSSATGCANGPIGRFVSSDATTRRTQFIKCLAVRAKVSSSAGVSSKWA